MREMDEDLIYLLEGELRRAIKAHAQTPAFIAFFAGLFLINGAVFVAAGPEGNRIGTITAVILHSSGVASSFTLALLAEKAAMRHLKAKYRHWMGEDADH